MRLEDIKISETFALTQPKEEKMCECREYWRYNLKQDRPIVVNHNNVLVDGYVMYLILLEHKEEYADVRKLYKKKKTKKVTKIKSNPNSYRNNPTTYIYAKHPHGKRILMWRVPIKWVGWADKLQIGDRIFCRTKYGIKPVIVQDVEILESCPVPLGVNRVHSQKIIRNEECINEQR
jgi:hypothetical protein